MIFFAFVILEQCYGRNSFFKMRNFSFLTWLGKRSYGLYLWHMVAVYCVAECFSHANKSPLLSFFFAVVLSVLLSALSYKYFETPFLKLKDTLFKPTIN